MEANLGDLPAVLRDVSRAVRRGAARDPGVEPLPASEVELLRIIVHRPGVSPGRLASEAGMKPSNVSAALRHLVERGLVSRESDPDDRRAARLRPTARALANARLIEESRSRFLTDTLATLPAEHREALVRAVPALRALAAALRDRTG
ncbi:MarR family winged helix-turn-helix transcriptional regulator [Nonomuraea sp. NPDC050783]|uniref:MarR family winged helix-turn-helix transcriptional regulator n=1 Tax=Nonomuraea sp. NPDC050783 TaxID=3154634 RepID=UPI003467EBC0